MTNQERLELLDKENMLFYIIGSLISSDKLTSVDECLDSKKKIEEYIDTIFNSRMARKSIYLRILEAGKEIVRNDLILLSNNSIINDNH